MRSRTIGGVAVSAIGMGAMPLSLDEHPPEAQGVRTISAALDAGVRLLDTADAYCAGEGDEGANERLIAKALATWSGDSDEVLVATKGGHVRRGRSWDVDGRPEHLRAACDASCKALGVEQIGLYQLHRPDPDVPFEESVGALRELLDAGRIRLAGISNVDADQIRLALGIVPLASVQNAFSPSFRSSADELALCAEVGVAFLPYSPLGGPGEAKELGRRHPAFAAVAREHGVSPQQVALAWELAQADVVIPIPGASRPETILDSLAAAELQLAPDEQQRLDREEAA